jgi:hypothetical protein
MRHALRASTFEYEKWVADAASQIWGGPSWRKGIFSFQRPAGETVFPETKRSSGTLRRRRKNVLRTTCHVPNLCALRARCVVRSICLPPPRSLRVRCTRRIHFRRDARWGRAGVTGHTASRNSAGSTTGGAAARLTAACGPARSGTNVAVKNSWPGKVSPARRQPRSHLLISRYSTVKRFGPCLSASGCKQAKSSCRIICTRLGALRAPTRAG